MDIFIVQHRFIDLRCLKRTDELIRIVISRDDMAFVLWKYFLSLSFVLPFIPTIIHSIYRPPFNTKCVFIWKIRDRNPSVIKIKEIIDEETNDVRIN